MVAQRGVGERRTAVRIAMLIVSAVCVLGLPEQRALAQLDESCKPEVLKLQQDTNHADSVIDQGNLAVCVKNVDDERRDDRLKQTEAEALRLAKMFFDVPEYHDEGRLPVTVEGTNAELGPVAGIYASPFLLGFTRPAQIYEQGFPGTLAGIVVVQAPIGTALPQSYNRLHLRPGLNCVWLGVNPPPPGMTTANSGNYLANLHWVARVTHAPQGGACDRAAATAATPLLSVVAVRNTGYQSDADYPPVARFDTDRLGRPIMAFRCLNNFCEVGVASEADVRTPYTLHRVDAAHAQWNPKPGSNTQQGQRQVVKGWHDEQALAVRGPDFRWRESGVKATIRPIPEAAQYDSLDYHNQWQSVARIEIENAVPPASKYYRWGFRQGINTVQFRYDAANAKWQARLRNQDGSFFAWSRMERIIHRDVTVPPIVRFRWTVGDDGVWAPCGNACCKASDD